VIVTCDTTRSKMVAPCDIRRSHLRRRHPGPPRPQCSSHRAHWRKPPPRPRQAVQNGLTRTRIRRNNFQGQQAWRPGRDHLVTGGGIIQESLGAIIPLQTGGFVGIGNEAARDKVRAIAKTEAYTVSCRERKKVEMLFAHLKRILRLGRLRLRGPSGESLEDVNFAGDVEVVNPIALTGIHLWQRRRRKRTGDAEHDRNVLDCGIKTRGIAKIKRARFKAERPRDRVDFCEGAPGQNRACARVGGRFRDQLAGVPGRPVDEDGSVQAAEEVRPSFE
jgi:hypothetical protein